MSPMVGAVSPEVSMVRPRFSARGRSISVASSAMRERSTWFRGEGPLVGAAEQQQCFGEVDRAGVDGVEAFDEFAGVVVGSLRATSRSVCVIASGVRSSWEAFAANRCCSATCASSRASMASKASASSRNSSCRPSKWIRWESDPAAAMRVASVMRARGASMRPARIHPPTRPNTSSNTSTTAALGAKTCRRFDRTGNTPNGGRGVDEERPVGDVAQQERPHGGEQQRASEHDEPRVAEGEFEPNAHTRGSIHRRPPRARCLVERRCGSRRPVRWR